MTPKQTIQNHNEEMEKEFDEKLSGLYCNGRCEMYSGANVKQFLLANNEKLTKLITAEVIKKMSEVGAGDGKPHNDTMELHQAIAWQEGYNVARDEMLHKAQELHTFWSKSPAEFEKLVNDKENKKYNEELHTRKLSDNT